LAIYDERNECTKAWTHKRKNSRMYVCTDVQIPNHQNELLKLDSVKKTSGKQSTNPFEKQSTNIVNYSLALCDVMQDCSCQLYDGFRCFATAFPFASGAGYGAPFAFAFGAGPGAPFAFAAGAGPAAPFALAFGFGPAAPFALAFGAGFGAPFAFASGGG
jgi:hypothetical protein